MPVAQNPVNTRLQILKAVYRMADKKADRPVSIDPAIIDGGYFNDINYQLRFLKERGLVDYKKSYINLKFKISLTPEGLKVIEDAFRALSLEEPEKSELLNQAFSRLKT